MLQMHKIKDGTFSGTFFFSFFFPFEEEEISFGLGFALVFAKQVPNRSGTGLAPPGLDKLRPLTAAVSFIKGCEFQKVFTHFHLTQSQLTGY